MPMLEVVGICTGYEGLEVLRDIDLNVTEGETVCVLGAERRGQVHAAARDHVPDPLWRGSVRFQGTDLSRSRSFVPSHIGMAYVPEGRGMLASLTVRENLEMGAYPPRARGALAHSLARVLRLFPALGSRLGDPAANLSGGQQQMLAIGRALMSQPTLIVLDETVAWIGAAHRWPGLRRADRAAGRGPGDPGGRTGGRQGAETVRSRLRHRTGPHRASRARARRSAATTKLHDAYLGL